MAAAFRSRFRRGTEEETSAAPAADESHEADDADAEGGEWLAYELHEWSRESRLMLQQLLTVDQVVHSWQGTTLTVHESLEEAVDKLLDEVEETEQAKDAAARPIGPDDELTAFELTEWPESLRAELLERLVQASVPYLVQTGDDYAAGSDVDPDETESFGEADGVDLADDEPTVGDMAMHTGTDGDQQAGGEEVTEPDGADKQAVFDLLVREADEERVEIVIDDLLAREEEAHYDELDGLELNDLLSRLFVACDRLRRDPRDPDGVQGLVANAGTLARVRTPFGFSAPNWRSLRNAATELLELVEADDTDEEDLREYAHRMSDTLRMLI